MSKLFLPVSIAVAVLLLASLGLRGKSRQPVPEVRRYTAGTREVTVALTDTGFDPKEVQIKKGTVVRWYNKTSGAKASINSDDFPTNKLFPELNLGNFMPAQSLTHIFGSKGQFRYHDQYDPKRKGTIVVE